MRRAIVGVLVACVALAPLPGCTDDDTSSADAPAERLVASFNYQPDDESTGPTSCPVRDVAFSDTSAGDPESWRWEFSGGRTSTEQNPVVIGSVTQAILTVTRGDESDSATETISIAVC